MRLKNTHKQRKQTNRKQTNTSTANPQKHGRRKSMTLRRQGTHRGASHSPLSQQQNKVKSFLKSNFTFQDAAVTAREFAQIYALTRYHGTYQNQRHIYL